MPPDVASSTGLGYERRGSVNANREVRSRDVRSIQGAGWGRSPGRPRLLQVRPPPDPACRPLDRRSAGLTEPAADLASMLGHSVRAGAHRVAPARKPKSALPIGRARRLPRWSAPGLPLATPDRAAARRRAGSGSRCPLPG